MRTARVPQGIWGYWDRDAHTGKYWGQILAKHQRGFTQDFYWPNGRRTGSSPLNPVRLARQRRRRGVVPPRDTMGLSPQWVARVKARVDARWRQLRPQVQRMQTTIGPANAPRTPTQYASPLTARGFAVPTQGQSLAGRIASMVNRLVSGLLSGGRAGFYAGRGQ